MASSPRTANLHRPRTSNRIVHDLLKLQRAAQLISSTLDLDLLIEKIVNDIAISFGCIEASVWLHDEEAGDMVLAGVRGCTCNSKGARLKVGKEGMIGHVAATGEYHYAPNVDLEEHYIRCEPGINSELVLPLKIGSRVIGIFDTAHHDHDAFPPEQIALLQALSSQMAIAVENARMYTRERQERERMTRELAEARTIQRALLPPCSPLIEGFAVEARCEPAGEVGGDWYDFIDLGDTRWGFVLADVAGKGMAAALLMSATRGILRSLATTCNSPADVLTRLNQVLVKDFPSERYVTMVYAVLDAKQRTLTYANAGHLSPLLVEGVTPRFLNGESGFPLGLMPTEYRDTTIELRPGARVLLYSDGITEAEDENLEQYGSDRLCEHLLSPSACADSLMDQLCQFRADCRTADDATVILLRSK